MSKPRQAAFALKVYYEDTDAGGIVYYANYLKFAERARTEFLAQAGLSNRTIFEQSGVLITVRRCTVDYLVPARLEDRLTLYTVLRECRGAKIAMTQKIVRDADQAVCAELDIILACVDEKGRAVRVPPLVLQAFTPYLMQQE